MSRLSQQRPDTATYGNKTERSQSSGDSRIWSEQEAHFYIYTGKGSTTDVPEDAKDLQKCAQAVAKVCLTLPTHANHKLFVDNWFTTLDLLFYLKERGIMRYCSPESPTRLPLEIKQRAESVWLWFTGL